ncbi:Translocation protein SEC62 [Dictyocoela muelleri]|nr:Translocation protein SEC62 [Dictyocoela muelleri]
MDAELLKVEKILRKIKTTEKILNNERRVQCITGNEIIEKLKVAGYEETIITQLMNVLLEERILIKGRIDKNYIKMDLDTKFKKDCSYMWVHEKISHLHLLISAGVILFTIFILMFQLWPNNLKTYATYASYPLLVFIGFMIIMGIVRLIFFAITFFTNSPGIWIFPNLFADVGIIDSFIPVWEYHGIDTKPKKKED